MIETALAQSEVEDTNGAVILSDQVGRYPLGLQLDILEDPSGQLTIEQVSSPEMSGRFYPSTTAVPQFGLTHSAIWARFRVEDNSNNIPYWLLEVRHVPLDYVDLFIPETTGGFMLHASGLLVPDSEQEIADNHYVFQIPSGLQADQPIYLRFATTNSMTIPATLWSPTAFNQMERNEELLWGIYYGIMLVMAVYNFLLFLSLRDRDYLFLVLYIVAVFIQTAFLDGRIKDILPSNLSIQYYYLQPIYSIPILPALLLFSTSFLKTKEFAPRLYKISLGLFVVFGLLTIFTFFFDRYLVVNLIILASLAGIIVVILCGLAAWRKHYRPARYFLVAMLVPMLFGIGDPLSRLGVIPFLPFFYSAAHFGNAALVTILSLALADRINYYRRQTEDTADKLRQSEALLTGYMDALPVGVAVYGQDKKPRWINRTALDLFHLQNYNPDIGLDRSIQDFPLYYSGSDFPYPVEQLPAFQALTGNPGQLEDIEIEIQGQRIPLEIVAKPIVDGSGKIQYAISVYQDISQRKLVEQQLESYRENLEELVVERTRQEQRQRAIAESLQMSASVLNRELNLDSVLTKILEQLPEVIPLDSGTIFLKEGDHLLLSNATAESVDKLGVKIPLSMTQYPNVKVFREAQSLFYADTDIDPEWDSWDKTIRIRSWMGTPLQSGGKVIGVLSVSSAQPGLYDSSKLPILEAFANHATIAIINARLYQESRMAAMLEERNRLARDLHDAVTQTLFSASLIAEALPLQWEQDQAGARANLKRLHQLTSGALAEMRMLLLELRPGSFQQSSLSTLLKHLCDAYQAKNAVQVHMNLAEGDPPALPVEVKEFFYRFTQEALNNITKHAKAGHVQIQLEQTEEVIRLRIQDDGRGFNPLDILPGHLGLQIMQERAAAIDANLMIESRPGEGTILVSEWKRQR
jgi:two-component system nitrate/nitrite sensor histidine kinase NarX